MQPAIKIAVLANDQQRDEWLSKPLPGHIEVEWAGSVRVLTATDADVYADLLFDHDPERTAKLLMRSDKPFLINAVPYTTKQVGGKFIRINGWPGFLRREVVEVAVGNPASAAAAKEVFDSFGWQYQLVDDVPGFVSARMVATIINEAYFAIADGVSSVSNINLAMKLGANYPMGPFEWGEAIGLPRVYELLNILNRSDGRYAIAPSLAEAVSRVAST